MPEKLRLLLDKNKYPLLLLLVVVLLCLTNYEWESTLSGWDNLHPEFNFNEYFRRIFFSVWQQHQGLGAVATQAHASEIPRVLYLYLTSLILPASLVRWFYFFLMLLIGPLGVFYVSKYTFKSLKIINAESYAFLSGLFYLLNLGTLQHFYVPLEMFATLYGFIGWLFLYLLKYLKHGKFRHLIIFSLLTLASTSMAHTSTLWLMYFITVVVFLLTYQLYFYGLKKFAFNLIRPVLIIVSTISLNLFWLLPNIYFVLTHANDVKDAKITRLFSEEAILNGLQYATFRDIFVFKNFLFNWKVHRGQDIFTPIFIEWENYLGGGFFILGFLFASVFLYGVYKSFFISKSKKLTSKPGKSILVAFFPIFIFSVFILKMSTAPFGFIFDFMVNYLPLFGEALRFPFTKVSIQLMFVCSIYFGYGVFGLKKIIESRSKSKLKFAPFIWVFTTLLLIYFYPAFKGEFFGPIMKVNYAKDYKEAYTYLNTFNNSRIAALPAHSLYGWVYYDWESDEFIYASYQGAGFSWFYSKNPILEREFDRWFPTNEQFYNEFQYAIYSENPKLLEYILAKYQIDCLLLDKNVIAPGSPRATFFLQTALLLAKTKGVMLDKTFGGIDVYTFNKSVTDSIASLQNDQNLNIQLPTSNTQSYIYAPSEFAVSNSSYDFSNVDSQFYGDVGDYISSQVQRSDLGSEIASSASLPRNDPNIQLPASPDKSGLSDFQFPFSDDKVLAKNLQNEERLSFSSNGYSKIYTPNINKGSGVAANILVEDSGVSTNLVAKYIYPEITDSKGNIVYSYQFSDNINLGDVSNNLVLIDNKLYQGIINNTFVLNNFSTAVVFKSLPLNTLDFSDQIFGVEPFDCGGNPSGTFGKITQGSSIVLIAKNHNVCATFDRQISIDKPSVVRVEFEYSSDTNNKPLYCIGDTSGSCLNLKYENSPFITATPGKYIDYFYAPSPINSNLTLILENPESSEAEVKISNVKVQVFEVSSTFSLKPSDSAYNTEKLVSIDSNKTYYVNFPDYKNLSFTYRAGTKYFNPEEKNCDNFNAKQYSRELVFVNEVGTDKSGPTSNQAFKYKALDAISCDSIKTPNLRGDSSYLVTINYQNVIGKALDICIAGTNLDKCMILDRLSSAEKSEILNPKSETQLRRGYDGQANSESQIQKHSFILPSYPSVSEYVINIGNQSIGRVASENNLYSIETRYVPYEFLKGIELANGKSQMANGIKVISVEHSFPHRYDAAISYKQSAISKTGLLVLNQSFDKGWGIYKKSSCKFGVVSPFTCAKAPAEHVLAKNWSNAWLINNEQLNSDSIDRAQLDLQNDNAVELVILFWPQWLQYFGYFFLVSWFFSLLLYYFWSHPPRFR